MREKERVEADLYDKRVIFNGFWKRFYGTFTALKQIYQVFNDKREEKRIKKRMLYCSNRIKKNFHIKIVQFGPTIEDRQINLSKYGLNSMIMFLNEPAEKRAEQIFQGFLTRSANKFSTFVAFLNFAKSVDFLNKFYKKRMKIKAIHTYVIDKIWDKSFLSITQNNILGKNKSKKVAKQMKKIYAISNEIKDKVLKCFYDHCVLEFKIKFILYRRKNINNNE